MLPHKILDVSEQASADEIKAAWKKKAFAHHPDRGGDPEAFKQAFRAYETLKKNPLRARSSANNNAPANQQPEDLDRYADAYYDAWLNVPSDVRFWLNTFETIHSASLFVAGPFLAGGLLMLLGGLMNTRGQQSAIGFVLASVCAILIAIAKSDFWHEKRFEVQDRYARTAASKSLIKMSAEPSTSPTATRTPDNADAKGQAFGCLIVCIALMVFAIAWPAKDADDIGGQNVFLVIVGIPAIIVLFTLLSTSNNDRSS